MTTRHLLILARGWTSCVVFTALILFAVTTFAAPITHFSRARVLTYDSTVDVVSEILLNENPLYVQTSSSTTGGTAATTNTFTGANGTASGQSEASLENGTLKAKAEATSLQNTGPFDVNANTFVRSDFGDSFRTFEGGGPFTWTNSTEATFSIDFSGTAYTGSGVNDRADVGFFISILKPGFLDGYAQWLINDDSFPSDLSANTIASQDYHLAGQLFSFQLPAGPLPTTIDFTFTPGGDFDWYAGITVDTAASLLGTSAADFFNTAALSYSGPQGTTTYSASGLFPGTMDLADLDSAAPIPEPGTLLLLGMGMAGLVFFRRKKQRTPPETMQI